MAKMGVAYDEKSVQELLTSEKIVAMIQAVSPVSYVKSGAAPAILSYGRKDNLVVWENVVSMMNALDAADVEYTLVEYPNSAHGLDKDADSAQRSVDAMLDYAKKYFEY
jgi:dipeptidyl aminopeptidase/acylaminoacyl peptidase